MYWTFYFTDYASNFSCFSVESDLFYVHLRDIYTISNLPLHSHIIASPNDYVSWLILNSFWYGVWVFRDPINQIGVIIQKRLLNTEWSTRNRNILPISSLHQMAKWKERNQMPTTSNDCGFPSERCVISPRKCRSSIRWTRSTLLSLNFLQNCTIQPIPRRARLPEKWCRGRGAHK